MSLDAGTPWPFLPTQHHVHPFLCPSVFCLLVFSNVRVVSLESVPRPSTGLLHSSTYRPAGQQDSRSAVGRFSAACATKTPSPLFQPSSSTLLLSLRLSVAPPSLRHVAHPVCPTIQSTLFRSGNTLLCIRQRASPFSPAQPISSPTASKCRGNTDISWHSSATGPEMDSGATPAQRQLHRTSEFTNETKKQRNGGMDGWVDGRQEIDYAVWCGGAAVWWAGWCT